MSNVTEGADDRIRVMTYRKGAFCWSIRFSWL